MHKHNSFLKQPEIWSKIAPVVVVTLLLAATLWSQASFRPNFLDRATVERRNADVTVTANYPLPLYQVLAALQGEYGWRINWESAPGYSQHDLADDTAPKWRLAHPEAKGVTRPSGGLFTTTFPDTGDTSLPTEKAVLQKVINDYNKTNNPGKYTVRTDQGELLAVVGTAVRDDEGRIQTVTPLLDTPLNLPRAKRNVEDTIALIISALQATSGVKVIQATAGTLFNETLVTLGGTSAPARDLLNETLAATGRPLQYGLFYNADRTEYQLAITLAMRETSDEAGARHLVPADRLPKR